MQADGVPYNYNLRIAEDTDSDPIETVEGISTLLKIWQAPLSLKCLGDGTNKVEDFLKRFDQYVSIVQIKKEH